MAGLNFHKKKYHVEVSANPFEFKCDNCDCGGGGGRRRGGPRRTRTQRGKEIRDDDPDLPFGEVAKKLKGQWKLVSPDEREWLAEEAEDMNERGNVKR